MKRYAAGLLTLALLLPIACTPDPAPPAPRPVAATTSAPTPTQAPPAYTPAPDPDLERLLTRATTECRVEGAAGQLLDCPDLAREIDARIRQERLKTLDSLLAALLGEDPIRAAIASWLVGTSFTRTAIADLGQRPDALDNARAQALLDAVQQLGTQERGAHRIARAAIFIATLKGMHEPVHKLAANLKDEEVKAAVVASAMRYGRMHHFELAQDAARAESPRLRAAAFQGARAMPDWTDDERARLCPWFTSFVTDDNPIYTQIVTSALVRCGGPSLDALLDEANTRAQEGRFNRSYTLALRELCAPPSPDQRQTSNAPCERLRPVLLTAAENVKLQPDVRAFALETLALYLPSREALDAIRRIGKTDDPTLQRRAAEIADALEKSLAPP